MAWAKVELRQLFCDDCGAPGPTALSRVDAALEAVVTGWAYTGSPLRGSSVWQCPKCKSALANGEEATR
jgi:hypothetical protein